tara:strand:- start:799 stop:1704 length:906 start_codon:yes stop_codon:yes gene_type:complete
MENHTAKHFALQLGSLASLYISLSFLVVLLFGLINTLFPDATDSVWEAESAITSIRIGIAVTIVFFPTYLVLTRLVNKARRDSSQTAYLGLTKWLIYLSLLVGGAVLLGDLVTVIMMYLEGELTQRFLLKAFALLVVVGSAFYYYVQDAKGYWIKNENKSILFGAFASGVVLVSLVLGFMNAETPQQAREKRLDETQVSDLREIQWRIQDHLAAGGETPETLFEVYAGMTIPTAPENRPPYEYVNTESGFMLCATFATESVEDRYGYNRPYYAPDTDYPTITNPDDWYHPQGDYCFERTVR